MFEFWPTFVVWSQVRGLMTVNYYYYNYPLALPCCNKGSSAKNLHVFQVRSTTKYYHLQQWLLDIYLNHLNATSDYHSLWIGSEHDRGWTHLYDHISSKSCFNADSASIFYCSWTSARCFEEQPVILTGFVVLETSSIQDPLIVLWGMRCLKQTFSSPGNNID